MVIHNAILTGSIIMQAPPVISGSLTLTGSITSTGPITGSGFFTAGTITAQTLVVQTITSSQDFVTGSTRFGSLSTNTHQFTGSMFVTGALYVTSGNVGIGTITPGTALEIRSGTGNTILGLVPNTNTDYALIKYTTANGTSYIGTDNSAGAVFGQGGYSMNMFHVGTGPIVLYTGGVARMFVSASGNVGIGTSSPQMPLSVQANTGNGAIRLIGTSNASSNNAGIYWYDSNDSTFNGYLGNFSTSFDIYNQRSTPIAFYTAGAERMRITSVGRVGIGTITPSKTLEVNGRMSTSAIVSGGIIAGNIASNMPAAPAYIPIFNLAEAAGFSLTGFVNAASYTCFNISQIYIRKQYTTSTINAGITGFYKSACDFSIVNITYSGVTYVALRFTGDPEIDVVWTGYLLTSQFNSDGSAQVLTSGVTLNSTYATY